MNEFYPSYYFDLADFSHRALFQSKAFVWNGLKDLTAYLSSLPLGKIESKIPEGVFLEDAHLVSIGKETRIEQGAYIKGPCFIGARCTIRHGAYIRGNVLVGDRCVIGHDTEVKHSILLNEAHAAHFNYIGDSILGSRTNLGAGVKCANLKLDRQPVQLLFPGQKIETGMGKLGAIIGDGTEIGCNAVTNPGTCLGKEVRCHPCLNVGGFFPSHSSIRGVVHTYGKTDE